MPVIDESTLPEKTAGPVTYRVLSTGPVMMLHLVIPENTILPEHEHENFQLGYVLSGTGVLIIGGESIAVSRGKAYTIPAHVPHALETGDESLEMLDIYYPPKEDR